MTAMTPPAQMPPAACGPAMCGPAAASTTDALQSLMSTYGDCRQEIVHLVDLRISHNLHSWAALTAARDVGSVMRAQQEWGMQAAADYFNGTARLAQLFTSLTLAGATPSVQQATKLMV